MASQWYYTRAGMRHGPVSPQELKSLAAQGQLEPADLVWREGMKSWQPARKVQGLFAATQVAQPPAGGTPRLPEAASAHAPTHANRPPTPTSDPLAFLSAQPVDRPTDSRSTIQSAAVGARGSAPSAAVKISSGKVTIGLVVVAAFISIGSIVTELQVLGYVSDARHMAASGRKLSMLDGIGFNLSLQAAEERWLAFLGLGLVCGIILAGTLALWMYRTLRYLHSAGVQPLRFAPLAGIYWWFVPFGNFVMPYLVMAEIWQASHPRASQQGYASAQRASGGALVAWWWGTWIAAVAFHFIRRIARGAFRAAHPKFDPLDTAAYDALWNLATLEMIVQLVFLAAAALTIFVIQGVVDRQRRAQQVGRGGPATTDETFLRSRSPGLGTSAAGLIFDIVLRRLFALTGRSAKVPATLTLRSDGLSIACPALDAPIHISRPPRKSQVKFVLGISPVEKPKGKLFAVKISGRLFHVDRKAADALAAWLPFKRPWRATTAFCNFVLMMLFLELALAVLLIVLMADGRLAVGIPLGPLIFGIVLFRAYSDREKYNRLEKQYRAGDPFRASLGKGVQRFA